MSNEQPAPLCPECARLQQLLEKVTAERNALKRVVTGKSPREDDLAMFKSRLAALEVSLQGLSAHIGQIFERLQSIERNQDPWIGAVPGSFGFSVDTGQTMKDTKCEVP